MHGSQMVIPTRVNKIYMLMGGIENMNYEEITNFCLVIITL